MNITHHFGDHEYIKRVRLEQGQMVGKHKHTYTHLSVLARGRVRVDTDNGTGQLCVRKVYDATHEPVVIEIKANVLHRITALEDSWWLCCHATDEKDPAKVDEVIVMRGRE